MWALLAIIVVLIPLAYSLVLSYRSPQGSSMYVTSRPPILTQSRPAGGPTTLDSASSLNRVACRGFSLPPVIRPSAFRTTDDKPVAKCFVPIDGDRDSHPRLAFRLRRSQQRVAVFPNLVASCKVRVGLLNRISTLR